MKPRVRWWLVGVSGIATVFRFHGLFNNTFYADEALFATWARLIAVWRDPLLQAQPVDKPPLLFYLQALFYPLQGPVEWAARLPNFIASILCVPLVGLLAWHLYRDGKTAVLAATILALSPLAIQFAPTAFTDPLLTTLLCASLTVIVMLSKRQQIAAPMTQKLAHPVVIPRAWAERLNIVKPAEVSAEEPLHSNPIGIPRRRRTGITARWSGLFFGLALATKYQALLFLPLLVGMALLSGWGKREWGHWLMGLFPVLLLLWLWDIARTDTFSLWSAQINNYGGLRLIWSWELWPRLDDWWQLWQQAWGTAVVAAGFWVVALLSLIRYPLSVIRKRKTDYRLPITENRLPITDHRSSDTLLILFTITYLALHWLLAVPIWDRYLLPLLPLTVVLLARGWRRLEIGYSGLLVPWHGFQSLLSSLLLLLLLIPAFKARSGQPTADNGTAQIATWLADAPYGTVLYDHWYSWHWRYHFFDKRVFVNWFPYPAALAEDLAVFGHDGHPRYLVLPADDRGDPIRRAVQSADFTLCPLVSDDLNRLTLYAIVEAE